MTPMPVSESKWRPISLALLAALSASLLAPTCPAQTTVQYSQGQVNTTDYDTSTPNSPLTLYTFQTDSATQSGRLTGTGAVHKTGVGTLYLTNTANNYSGGTTVKMGDLAITNTAALGTGPVVVHGGYLTGGSSNLTFNTSVSVIQLAGAGTRTGLSTTGFLEFGTHTASSLAVTKGGFVAASSSIAFGVGAAPGISTGAVTDAGSTLSASLIYVGAYGGSAVVGVSAGGEVKAASGLHLGFNGGQGTFNLLTGGTLSVGNGITANDAASEFNFAGGTLVTMESFSTDVSMHLTNASTIHISHPDRNTAQLNGVLWGTGSLTKTGADALRLTAANTYSGGTIISVGTLEVNNTSGSGTGTGTVTIAAGAALRGSFTISGATTIAGSLNAGAANFSGDLTLQSTATTLLDLNSDTSFDTIDVAGTLKLDGTVVIVTTGGYVVQAGTQFDLLGWSLLDAGSFDLATDLDLSGAALAAGVTWDTSAFLTHGVLTAVPEPSTYALLAFGALGLCIHLFRRCRTR